MTRIFFDTDLGICNDDCQALVLATRSPTLRLEAVSVCAGNLTMRQSLYNALTLLEYLGRPGTKVYAGEPAPLRHEYGAYERAAFGEWGSDAEPEWPFGYPAGMDPQPGTAAQALRQLATADQGDLTVLALGPLTNLAVALRDDPRLASAIGEVVCMGGAFEEIDATGGNVTPAAEFNFWVDPDAANAVVSSGVRMRLVPWNLGRRFVFSDEEFLRLCADDTRVGRLYATMRETLRRQKSQQRLLGSDALAVALLLWPELFTVEQHGVAVDTTPGSERYGASSWTRGAPPIGVAVDCDLTEVRNRYFDQVLRIASATA